MFLSLNQYYKIKKAEQDYLIGYICQNQKMIEKADKSFIISLKNIMSYHNINVNQIIH